MSASEVSPRIATLDVMRGVGIMGILFANILGFAFPVLAPKIIQPVIWQGIDFQIEQWTTAFVTGKFRGLLCILFGVGLWLQYQSREKRDSERASALNLSPVIPARKEWPYGYMRRMGWLFLIGCIHGFFFWFGDILALYAITALCFSFVVRYETKTLWRIVAVLSAIAFVIGLAMAASPTMSMGPDAFKDTPQVGSWLTGELQAFQSGTYLQQLGYRVVLFGLMLVSAVFLIPLMGMLFTIGIIFARERLLTHPFENPELTRKVLAVSLGIGLPVNAMALFISDTSTLSKLATFLEIFGACLLSVGYLMLMAMALRSNAIRVLMKPVQAVGRMAMTSYLSQTLICTTLYYSWGFGLFGKQTRTETLIVVGGVLVFNLIFASLWLRFFTIGPIEAWWRARADGRKFELPRVARQI